MTRFARAKGSKASNERIPEQSTPWHVMKEELQKKQQEKDDQKKRKELETVREKNYKAFLEEHESKVEKTWADITEDHTLSKVNKQTPTKGIKKTDASAKKFSLTPDMLDMLKPDKKIDKKLQVLQKQIERSLKKEKDDAPTEMSSKIEPAEIVVAKAKYTKKVLKIDSVAKENGADVNESKTDGTKNVEQSELKLKKKGKKQKNKKGKETGEVTEAVTVEAKNNVESDTAMTSSKRRRMRKIRNKAKQENGETEVAVTGDTGATADKGTTVDTGEKSPKKGKKRKNKNKANDDAEGATGQNPTPDAKNKKTGEPKTKKPKVEPTKTDRFPPKFQKPLKVAKVRDDKEHPRRKPDQAVMKMNFNGREIEVVKFEGFPVKKEDAERLTELRKNMRQKGIPQSEIRRTLQLERRKAEKALSREKKTVCFQCRKAGHLLAECPEMSTGQIQTAGTGICFKCGSTEHTHFECKVTKTDDYRFASCFICKEQGHISRQCPDNPRGLYPKGGACKLCGDVTHLRKDCPTLQNSQDNDVGVTTLSDDVEGLDGDKGGLSVDTRPKSAPATKVVKF